jgi:Lon-like protease
MRKLLAYLLLGAAIVATFVAGFLPLPYYSLAPGPAREVEPLIMVQGRPSYPSDGHLVMTTVAFRQVTAVGALLAWADPDKTVVSRDVLYPGGETTQQEVRGSISEMDQSKIDAASVVLRSLEGYPRAHGAGSLIRATVPGCSADGKLFPGDLVVAINGRAIAGAAAAKRAIESIPSGRTLTFDVRPLGTGSTQTLQLTRRPCGGSERPLVGVSMVDAFPFGVEIHSGDVGGPSAGLMWALGLYDLLTPGDLTGGRTIAGTGTIARNGTIGAIGGIEEKVRAAHDVGATELLVPTADMADARAVGETGLRLVPVASFEGALDALRAEGGSSLPAPTSTPNPAPSPTS